MMQFLTDVWNRISTLVIQYIAQPLKAITFIDVLDILILAIIFGVVAGTIAADAVSLAQMIGNGELPGWTMADIPEMLLILLEDAEYLAATAKNILMGLLFAALGVFALLRQTGKEVSGIAYAELK